MSGQKHKSIVLGFCKCKHCGYEKFYWNTFFVCEKCGCKEYTKERPFNDEEEPTWR